MWRSTFGGDPHVLGRVIRLNGAPYTVVGVMLRSFEFPSRQTQLWIPVALRENAFTIQGGRVEKWLHMVARLSSDATPQRAELALQTTADALAFDFPTFYPRNDS